MIIFKILFDLYMAQNIIENLIQINEKLSSWFSGLFHFNIIILTAETLIKKKPTNLIIFFAERKMTLIGGKADWLVPSFLVMPWYSRCCFVFSSNWNPWINLTSMLKYHNNLLGWVNRIRLTRLDIIKKETWPNLPISPLHLSGHYYH